MLVCESDRARTGSLTRKEGFLCVWDEGETLRRRAVTASPLEICSNTAPISEVPLSTGTLETPLVGKDEESSKEGSGGGGGGGGGGPDVAEGGPEAFTDD